MDAASLCQTSSDASSAHCRSSMTITVGAAAHSSSVSAIKTSTLETDASPSANSPSRWLRSRRAACARRGSGELGRTCRQSCITLSGIRSVSWSAIPHPISHPRSLVPARASTTRDDLPMPGSPSTQTAALPPWRRASTPARRVASSWLRSTHVGGRSMGHMVVTYAPPGGNAYSVEERAATASQAGQVGRDDDIPLLDLAGRALGQRVHDPHVPRVLVGRHLALDVVPQLLGADDGPRLEGHRGA